MALRPLRVLSLCSGVGGLDLGLRLALAGRCKTVCYVEREAFAAAVLVARMEDEALDRAPVWDDIETFDGRAWRGAVDCVLAGYPCQPFSCAGKRLGEGDERHLWPHVRRVVEECGAPLERSAERATRALQEAKRTLELAAQGLARSLGQEVDP